MPSFQVAKKDNKDRLSQSSEDYLETILMLYRKNDVVRSIDISHCMGVSKPSVTNAVQLLKKGGYITVNDCSGLSLTAMGKEIAEKILERHLFFTDMLITMGVTQDTARHDACCIEHAISDESFQKIKQYIAHSCLKQL